MNLSLPARIIDRISAATGYISAVLIVVAMLVVCYGVVLRYVLGASTIWQTEATIYLLMFASFVGGTYGLRHGDHVRVDLVVDKLPARARLALRFITGIMVTGFAVVVAVVGIVMWWHALQEGARSGTAWNPPLWVPYAILPLGMILISLQYLSITARIGRALFTGQREVQEFVPPPEGTGEIA